MSWQEARTQMAEGLKEDWVSKWGSTLSSFSGYTPGENKLYHDLGFQHIITLK